MTEYNIIDVDFLLQRVSLNDDQEAYRQLFELYYVPLCLFIRQYIDDKPTREDIVQDVFFTIWEKRKNITFNTSAKNYLITAVKNRSLNYLRTQGYMHDYRAKLAQQSPPSTENLDDLYTLKELQDLLSVTLAAIPTEYRLAFEMSRLDNKSTTEIAAIMHVSTRTVERYREKAETILKEELKDYLPLLYYLIAMHY